jgi:hypothetical protein
MCEESVGFRCYHGVPEMKHPALTGGGSLQLKLGVTRLLLASVPETVPNRGIVDPHRGSEQSSCPDTAPLPLHVAQHVREYLFQLPTGHAFQGKPSEAAPYWGFALERSVDVRQAPESVLLRVKTITSKCPNLSSPLWS